MAGLVRDAAGRHEDDVPVRLDRVVAGEDLRPGGRAGGTSPAWGRPCSPSPPSPGAVWLVGLALLGCLQLGDAVPTPDAGDIPVPTLLLAGGAVAGLVLALVARWINGAAAARRARTAQRRLTGAVGTVADELIVAPVQAELATRRDLCAALARAAG